MRNTYQPKSINYNIFDNIKVKLSDGVELTNAVAGATVDIPPADAAWFPVLLNLSVNTVLRLPLLASVPYNYEYLFTRPPGSATASSQLIAIIPQNGETLNGRNFNGNVNGASFITSVGGSAGVSARVRRAETTWITTDCFNSPVLDVINADTNITPWAGSKLLSLNAAGITVTLPALSNTIGTTIPRGSTLTIISTFAGNTVSAGATGRFFGSLNGNIFNNATSFPMGVNESAIVTVLSNFVWIVH